jgi:DNA-binding Lrp family transcriptional regulator
MDELNKKILKELQLDSRKSFTRIAQNLGVTTATVIDRVKKLTEKGIICGYTTILNTYKLGMITLIAKIKIRSGYNIENVGKEIARLYEICCVHHVTGNFDLLVISKCAGHENCGCIIEEIKEVDGVETVDTEIVLKTLKEAVKVEL